MIHFIISVLGIYIGMFLENPVEFLIDVIGATFSPATAEAVAYNICNAMELFLSGFT